MTSEQEQANAKAAEWQLPERAPTEASKLTERTLGMDLIRQSEQHPDVPWLIEMAKRGVAMMHEVRRFTEWDPFKEDNGINDAWLDSNLYKAYAEFQEIAYSPEEEEGIYEMLNKDRG